MNSLQSAKEDQLRRMLRRHMGKAIEDWDLIEDGDRILVAMSGGKDSYVMLDILRQLQRAAPVHFTILAYHLDQAQPGHDATPLREWLAGEGVETCIERHDTYSVVVDKTEEGGTYCVLCSRLRRGILYSVAEREGCTKIALGHHRDDVLETLLLNMMFAGRLKTMPAILKADDGRNTVIRPLIYCSEEVIARYAEKRAFPILPCNLCGSQENLWRQQAKEWLLGLEQKNPAIKSSMMTALANIRPSHLLDRTLRDAVAGLSLPGDQLQPGTYNQAASRLPILGE